MATDPNAAIYDALRKADAAGDAASVARLAGYLNQQKAMPDTDANRGSYGSGGVEDDGQGNGAAFDPNSVQGYRDPHTGRLVVNVFGDQKGSDAPTAVQDDGSAGAAARGAADSITLGLAPRLMAVGDVINNATGGLTGATTKADGYDQNLELERNRQALDQEHHQASRLVGQLIGGLALPSGLEGVAFGAGKAALKEGATLAEARAIAAAAATKRASAVGAGYGGAYGFDSSYGDAGERLLGAGAGAATGALGGLAFGKAGEALAPRQDAARVAARALPIPDGAQVGLAAERQGVDVLPADVGGTGTKFLTGIARMTLGGIPLADAAERTIASAKSALDRVAGRIGTVTDNTGAGQAAQRGAKTFIDNTEARGGQLYDAIPIPAGRPAVLSNTKQALADLNAGLESNDELSNLISDPRMQAIESAIAGRSDQVPTGLLDANGNPIMRAVQKGGQLSWQDLKAFRTYIGEKAGQPSLNTDTSQAALQRLYAGLSEDMRATAQDTSPQALSAFNRANQYWRGRQARIDNVLSGVLGNEFQKGSTQAFEQINRWAQTKGGDPIKLAQALRSLPDDERRTVQATLLDHLGDATAGAQNAKGDAFSPSTFGTNWNKLSPRAKSFLFPDAKQRADVNDIATILGGIKSSEKFANTSRTALAGNGIALITAALSGPVGLATAAGTGGGQLALGKILASPRLVQWLVAAAKKPNPPALLAHVNRLSAIAKAEPSIATDALNLQQRLASYFTQAPSKVAAQPDTQSKQ